MKFTSVNFYPEFTFKTSRSSGKGGQNVNKVSSKVELNFDIAQSELLSDAEKQFLLKKIHNRINKNGILQIIVQSERSQLQNKEAAVKKFHQLLTECFKEKKKRIATAPNKTSKEKRIKGKKIKSEKKNLRSKKYFDDAI